MAITGAVMPTGAAKPQNLPLAFFQSAFGGMASMVSQCSAIFPFWTRNRS